MKLDAKRRAEIRGMLANPACPTEPIISAVGQALSDLDAAEARIATLVEVCKAALDGLHYLTEQARSPVTHREAIAHGGIEHSVENSIACPACRAVTLLDAALRDDDKVGA